MALGRRSTFFRSLMRMPARFISREIEKNAIAAVIAKRGWAMNPKTGVNTGEANSRARTSHEPVVCREARAGAMAGSTMLVFARMLWTRLAGGSTKARDFSQFFPDSAWVNRGPQS